MNDGISVAPPFGVRSSPSKLLKNEKVKPSTSQEWDAAFALGDIGPTAKAAIPALAEALKDEMEFWSVRNAAQAALKKIQAEK